MNTNDLQQLHEVLVGLHKLEADLSNKHAPMRRLMALAEVVAVRKKLMHVMHNTNAAPRVTITLDELGLGELEQQQPQGGGKSMAMNNSLIVALRDDSVRFVGVKLGVSPEHANYAVAGVLTYKTRETSLRVGDLVVVEQPGNAVPFMLGYVAEVDASSRVDWNGSNVDYKWVVGAVSINGYKMNLEAEKVLIEEVKRAERLAKRESLKVAIEEQLGLLEAPKSAPSAGE